MSNVAQTGTSERYLLGVVEGFYGDPWSPAERQDLFRRMKSYQMNTYLYAPKHDEKHRHQWREKYTLEELELLKHLIESSRAFGVDFVFSVSPGLDLIYSSDADLRQLLDKFEELQKLGCHSFAILFDDINCRLGEADESSFESPAHAQASTANYLLENLSPVKDFMFCPTEYCGKFAQPNVPESEYLRDIGNYLHSDIIVMWTGPSVVSKTISKASIERISQILKRPPIIWDNFHANDYDRQRVFLGPYSGRHTDLIGCTKGVLTNPNCQYDSNFVAIHTLGAWKQSYKGKQSENSEDEIVQIEDSKVLDSKLNESNISDEEEHVDHGDYCPKRSLVNALSDWLPSFITSGVAERIDLEDLVLLSDFFFLPYEYGKEARKCVKILEFIADNTSDKKSEAWKKNIKEIKWIATRIERVAERMSRCASCNSSASTMSPFLSDLSKVFWILVAFITWLDEIAEEVTYLSADSKKVRNEFPSYNYIDDDLETNPELTVTSRLLAILPRPQLYQFIVKDFTTPWFPGLSIKYSKPSKTRHGIFESSDEMEFDDSQTWPLSELIRLDNMNIPDENIYLALNTTIHPLEHATALITRSEEGELTSCSGVYIHLAVRQKSAMASLHSVSMMLVVILSILSCCEPQPVRITLDSGTENFKSLLRNLSFEEINSQNQSTTRSTFLLKN